MFSDAHGSWDGSLQIPNEWNGITEPVVIMAAVPGKKPGDAEPKETDHNCITACKGVENNPRAFGEDGSPDAQLCARCRVGMAIQMAVVRAANASAPLLVA